MTAERPETCVYCDQQRDGGVDERGLCVYCRLKFPRHAERLTLTEVARLTLSQRWSNSPGGPGNPDEPLQQAYAIGLSRGLQRAAEANQLLGNVAKHAFTHRDCEGCRKITRLRYGEDQAVLEMT